MDLSQAMTLSAAVAAVAAGIGAAETLAAAEHYGAQGLASWDVVRTARGATVAGLGGAVFGRLFGGIGLQWLSALRLLVAGALLALCIGNPEQLAGQAVLLTVLAVLTGLFHLRCVYGLDGSDQMLVLALFTLATARLAHNDAAIVAVCGWFLAIQAILSYFVAGAAKVIARTWRDGSAVLGVMRTENYGNRRIAALLATRPRLTLVLAWLLLAFELSFPLVLVAGPYAAVFLVGGIVFHLLNAGIMGLNVFLWSFAATYPVLYVCARACSTWLYH